MGIENEKTRLSASLDSIQEHCDAIASEAQTIQEIQRDIVNQIPNTSDWNKVMRPLNEVTLDVGNGVTVVMQGVTTGRKVIKQTLPGITFK